MLEFFIAGETRYCRPPRCSSDMPLRFVKVRNEQTDKQPYAPDTGRGSKNMRYSRFLSSFAKRAFPWTCLLVLVMAVAANLRAVPSSAPEERVAAIIAKMKSAYAQVEAYRTDAEVEEYREGRIAETRRFVYTFKKPDHLRIDMESPHPGLVLVYPDEEGKVSIKPGGLAHFFKLRLAPDNPLLTRRTGQRIDQTDLGLLIRNIEHSLTDQRYGEIGISSRNGSVVLDVLAADHFLAGIRTRYLFFIDKKTWLPTEVDELTPDAILKRKVIFRDLKIMAGIPDKFFQLDGENAADGQPAR